MKHTYPHVKVLARAYDRGHKYLLRQAGADYIESETYHSALEIGMEVMRSLDHHPAFVQQQKNIYQRVENQSSDMLYAAWLDDAEGERFDNNYRKLFMELEESLKESMQASGSEQTDPEQQNRKPSLIHTVGNIGNDS